MRACPFIFVLGPASPQMDFIDRLLDRLGIYSTFAATDYERGNVGTALVLIEPPGQHGMYRVHKDNAYMAMYPRPALWQIWVECAPSEQEEVRRWGGRLIQSRPSLGGRVSAWNASVVGQVWLLLQEYELLGMEMDPPQVLLDMVGAGLPEDPPTADCADDDIPF